VAFLMWMGVLSKKPQLALDRAEVIAGGGSYVMSVPAWPSTLVAVRYSLDGAEPQEMSARLDSKGSMRFDVGPETVKGTYHLLSFRRKEDLFWIQCDAAITVK